MQITVRVYAALREAVGSGRFVIDVPSGAAVSDVFDRIVDEYPQARSFRSVMRGAIDDAYVPGDVVVEPDAELHVITPVSGG